MTAHTPRRLGCRALTIGCLLLVPAGAVAQTNPPIPGVTGTVQPENNPEGATPAVATAVEKTVEGTRQLLRAIGIGDDKGEKPKSAELPATLQPGTMVVVHGGAGTAAVSGQSPGNAQETEARVIDVTRGTGVIVIRLPDRTTERLQLDPGRAREPDPSATQETDVTVTVSYVDGKGQKVMLTFRKVP